MTRLRSLLLVVLAGTGCGGTVEPTVPGTRPAADEPRLPPAMPPRHYLFEGRDGTGTGNEELWYTNGTSAGTRLLKDVAPGVAGSYFGESDIGHPWYVVAGDRAYVFAVQPRRELWRTDGTAAGTMRLRDFGPTRNQRTPQYEYPHHLTAVGSTIFFAIDDGQHGSELWRSDGTEAGTSIVADLVPGGGTPVIAEVVSAGRQLFIAYERSLLRSDEGGRVTETFTFPTYVRQVRPFGDGALAVSGPGLYRTDGTPPGTTLVQTFAGASLANLTVAGDRAFFFVSRPESSADELWITDGTAAGTSRGPSFPRGRRSTAAVGRRVFAASCGTGTSCDLWSSDGTDAGTSRLRTTPGTRIDELLTVGTRVLFVVGETDSSELWAADGEGGEPRRLLQRAAIGSHDLRDVSGIEIFRAQAAGCTTSECPLELWRTDGTKEGTVMIRALLR
jgi:ELWxxDGT repeat protein